MIEYGIDEYTIVLQLNQTDKNECDIEEWPKYAEGTISIFASKAGLRWTFGKQTQEAKPPQGYTVAYTYGEHPFYFAIAYHPYQMHMGVVVKFSAQALDFYCSDRKIKPYQLLQKVYDEDLYKLRLSRVDLTADFIDEGINVTRIYNDLQRKRVAVFREYESEKTGETCYRKTVQKYQGYAVDGEVPTVYLGSVKSNSRLRIYDKKREQIERSGNKLDKAKRCKDWVRFEGVFRNDYAHQISEELLQIKSDDEYANLIACTLAQKYRLMYVENGVVDCDTEYTQAIIDSITNGNFALRAPNSRNYELAKNLGYLLRGSGIIPTLYKIKEIWGVTGVAEVLAFVNDYLDEWTPSDDCKRWLRVYKDDYQQGHPKFTDFFDDVLRTAIS